MYVVVETGGKQYRVQEGNKPRVEKLDTQVGDTMTFDKVPLLGSDDVRAGRPHVEGAKVEAKALEQSEAKKVVVYKFKAEKNYRSKRGHHQPYTFIEIGTIT